MKLRPRYLIRGLMDGSISTLGVVLGAFNPDVGIILAAGAAGTMANGVSNIVAAFTAEYTGHYQDLRHLEQATLSSLEGTLHEQMIRRKMFRDAAFDGLASLFGGLVPLLPFLFLPGQLALYTSIGLCCVLLGTLGLAIGALTKRNLLMSLIKLIVMTLVTAVICYAIGNVIQTKALLR